MYELCYTLHAPLPLDRQLAVLTLAELEIEGAAWPPGTLATAARLEPGQWLVVPRGQLVCELEGEPEWDDGAAERLLDWLDPYDVRSPLCDQPWPVALLYLQAQLCLTDYFLELP